MNRKLTKILLRVLWQHHSVSVNGYQIVWTCFSSCIHVLTLLHGNCSFSIAYIHFFFLITICTILGSYHPTCLATSCIKTWVQSYLAWCSNWPSNNSIKLIFSRVKKGSQPKGHLAGDCKCVKILSIPAYCTSLTHNTFNGQWGRSACPCTEHYVSTGVSASFKPYWICRQKQRCCVLIIT